MSPLPVGVACELNAFVWCNLEYSTKQTFLFLMMKTGDRAVT
ncbi:Hypothetical protein BFG00_0317 [Corynebacterium pseudotuberculosis]|nr:Hypothetical protein BFG00_0317 [Corynebacterium pseudotuberculosis]